MIITSAVYQHSQFTSFKAHGRIALPWSLEVKCGQLTDFSQGNLRRSDTCHFQGKTTKNRYVVSLSCATVTGNFPNGGVSL